MLNKIIYFIIILLAVVLSSCNSHINSTGKSDCITVLKNNNKSFDTSKKIDDYLKEVTNHLSNLKQNDLKKIYNNCSKSEVMKYYINEHPLIDSVTVTPSGHGISFFRKDDMVWTNILIE